MNIALKNVVLCLDQTEQEIACYDSLIREALDKISCHLTSHKERTRLLLCLPAWRRNYDNAVSFLLHTVEESCQRFKEQGNVRYLDLIKLQRLTLDCLKYH